MSVPPSFSGLTDLNQSESHCSLSRSRGIFRFPDMPVPRSTLRQSSAPFCTSGRQPLVCRTYDAWDISGCSFVRISLMRGNGRSKRKPLIIQHPSHRENGTRKRQPLKGYPDSVRCNFAAVPLVRGFSDHVRIHIDPPTLGDIQCQPILPWMLHQSIYY